MTTKKAKLLEIAENLTEDLDEILDIEGEYSITFHYDEFGCRDVEVTKYEITKVDLNEG